MTVKRVVANIATDRTDAAKAFYGDLLGMTVAMDLGWIVTFAGSGDAAPQISFAAERFGNAGAGSVDRGR